MNLLSFDLYLIVLTFLSPIITTSEDIPRSLHYSSDGEIANIRQDFNGLAKDFLESLKIAHKLVANEDEEELVRSRRSVDSYHQKKDSFFDKGVFRLKGVVPLYPTCARPIDYTTAAFNGQTYGICVSQPTDDIPAKVTVGPISGNGWHSKPISWFVRDPKNVVSFVDENKDTKDLNLYVMIADSGSGDGTDVVVINKHNERITKEQHTVNSRYPTAIAVWKSRTDNTYHLAIANSYGPDWTQSFKSVTFTYYWMSTYFDRYSEMTTYYVRDICAFSLHSNEFLAVANYKAGPNEVVVDSEIFKLDIDRKKWRSFQRIRTFGAIDWEFFTFGTGRNEEYFLAVANNFDIRDGRVVYEVNSVIYKFSDDKFVPFQALPTLGATQIKSFKGVNGEFILGVANMYQAVHLYQYNGWHFVETSVQYTSGVMSPGVVSLHFDYVPQVRNGVLFVSNPHHPSGHMFQMEFIHENPLGEWHNKSLQWCESTDRGVKESAVNKLMPLLKDVFYVDQKEPIVINDDVIMSDIVVDSLTTPLVIDGLNGEELSHKLIEDLYKLNEELNVAEEKLGQIVDTLSNALRTSGEQVVTASHAFNSVDFECKQEFDCLFRRIDTNVLNNDNINGLSEDIVPLNMDQSIGRDLHFQHLRVDNNIILKGLLNGFNTSAIVTKGGIHDITAEKTFASEVKANEVIVNHLINDKAINPLTVLLTIGDQVLNNTIVFQNDIHLNNLQSKHINGIDIESFFSEVVTKDSNHIIRGEKHFNAIEMNDLLMKMGTTVDGIDIMRLWRDVLWTYGDEDINSALNFTDLIVDRNLFVEGLINGIQVPKDVIKTNGEAVISGNKRFLSSIALQRIDILHSINGIGLVDHSLDIMSKSREQTVFGQKVFNGMHLGGHSRVRGAVDGVKLSQLKRTLLLRNTSQRFDELEIRGDALFDGGIDVKTTINGLKLEDFYRNALKLTDSRIQPFPQFHMNDINAKSMQCLSINGLNIGFDLLTKNTAQVVRGQKVFINGVSAESDVNIHYINGIDMIFINDTLIHDFDQHVTGEKIFESDLFAHHLVVNTINNVSMNDLVLLNRDEVITAPKVFEDVQIIGGLNVQSLDSNVINGIEMRDFFENSLQFEKPQTMTGRPNFVSVYVPKGSNFGTKSVNGVNLQHLMSDAVLVDIPQTIFGAKTFVAPITIDAINFRHSVDNVSDFDLKYNWLLQDSSQTIHSNVYFNSNLEVNDNILMKNAVINGIDLNLLDRNAVKVDESTVISGVTQFSGTVVSKGHIELKGRIQGIDLDREAVTLNGDHRLVGRIHFVNGFQTDEHLLVNGTVDGIRVEELCRSSVLKNKNQLITGPTRVTGNVYIKGALSVNSGINGRNIEEFYRNVVKVNEPSVITGLKRFGQLIINGPVIVNKLIAGFNVEKVVNNYMSITREQTVGSKVVFMNDLTVNGLKINGNIITKNSSINGLDLNRLNGTALKTSGDQLITADFTFEDNVYFGNHLNVMNRRVNGLDLLNDFMIRGRNNVITVPKIFSEDIHVINNLDIKDKKTIGSVDVSEMAKFSVAKSSGKYRVDGEKGFSSIEVDHLRVSLLNGIDISNRTLLLSYGNQRLNSLKVLNNDLKVNSEINSKTVDLIDVQNLSQRLVLKGFNNSINSMKTFVSPLNVHNVRAFGRVDGVDLNELNYFIGLPVDLRDLRLRLGKEDQKIDSIERALNQQSIDLSFYELISTIPSGPALHWYYNSITRSQHLFISGQKLDNGCQVVDIYVNSNHVINWSTKVVAIEANLMTSFESNERQFAFISNTKSSKHSLNCLQMNSSPHLAHIGSGPAVTQVFVFDGQQKKYIQRAVIHSQSVTDLNVIDDQNPNPCVLMSIPVDNGILGHSVVVCLDKDMNFYFRETIPHSGRDQSSIISSKSLNKTFMVSINSWQRSDWMSDLMISDWSSHLKHFSHDIQSIPFLNPMAVHFVDIHSSLYLFAAEKKTSLSHKPLVRIFRYNSRRVDPFSEVQQIKDIEVIQMESTFLDKQRVLVFILTKSSLDLYELKGSSGFVRKHRIDVRNAESFVINDLFYGQMIALSFNGCYHKIPNLCKRETHVLFSKFD